MGGDLCRRVAGQGKDSPRQSGGGHYEYNRRPWTVPSFSQSVPRRSRSRPPFPPSAQFLVPLPGKAAVLVSLLSPPLLVAPSAPTYLLSTTIYLSAATYVPGDT